MKLHELAVANRLVERYRDLYSSTVSQESLAFEMNWEGIKTTSRKFWSAPAEEYEISRFDFGSSSRLRILKKLLILSIQAVWRIRIRGIRIISLDPDPYKKMAGSGIRIRIK